MATADFYLKIDGIDGESKDDKMKDCIELMSWSWGGSNSAHAAGGGGGAGKFTANDFHFTMNVCKSTPKLLEACSIGKHIKKATLTCRKAGGEQYDYLKIDFTDVMVTSYQTGGSSGAEMIPVEQISLNFAKYEMEYKEQKPDGAVVLAGKSGYDLKKNVKV